MNARCSLLALALLTGCSAHMSLWSPSMYGFDESYEPVTPLANKPFDQWWFHGYTYKQPREVMSIYPGRDLTVELACSKSYSTFGNSPSPDGCPGDSGSFHAGGGTGSSSGWWGNSESNLMGCALAIAPKAKASDVRPEDFVVMSVQENCVRQRDTPFAIPANLPSCPDGECTCAWFWQGKNSAAEMYMIGFKNGMATAFPSPAKPKRGAISGPTQPMYWANDRSNLDYTPGWDDRPSYNSKFGWRNGAQTSAFAAGNAGGGTTRSSSTQTRTSTGWNDDASSTSTRGPRTTSTNWNDNKANSTSSGSRPTQWNQHLAEGTASSSTTTAASSTSSSAAAPTKTKVCRRGHLKRRSRNHS